MERKRNPSSDTWRRQVLATVPAVRCLRYGACGTVPAVRCLRFYSESVGSYGLLKPVSNWSTTTFASPNNIRVLSLKKSGF